MGITLSHISALDATRTLRSEGMNVYAMDRIALRRPSYWRGRRWSTKLFDDADWRWTQPSKTEHLHALVDTPSHRIRMDHVDSHLCPRDLPPKAFVWLDSRTSMVCPELLFLQMSSSLSLPALVMLGYELCGNFSRTADSPFHGEVTTLVPAATSVGDIVRFLDGCSRVRGITRARKALKYVSDHAVSAPEAQIATMYSLPRRESGYGLGPVTLNERVLIDDAEGEERARTRYPDLMLSFAPIGINYDGEVHLDLDGLVDAAREAALAEGEKTAAASTTLADKKESVRSKYVDDIRRTRQLMASGRLVLPMTKEDLETGASLDLFTQDLLKAAHNIFGVDVHRYLQRIDSTGDQHDRAELLDLLRNGTGLPGNGHGYF